MKLSGVLAHGLLLLSAVAGAAQHETFDQPGSQSEVSILERSFRSGGGLFLREESSPDDGLEVTDPPLPISPGNDKELRYHASSLAPSAGWALTRDDQAGFHDCVQAESYLALGITEQPGLVGAGLGLRMTGSHRDNLSGYVARVVGIDQSSRVVAIRRLREGVLAETLASAELPSASPATNYHLRFLVAGDRLELGVWLVSVVSGKLVETAAATLVAQDGELVSGGEAVVAFARGSNSAFFDDLVIEDCHRLIGDDFESDNLSRWTLHGAKASPASAPFDRRRDSR